MSSHTFLVTGAAGFIGSNLVQYLLDHNHNVIAFDNLSTGKKNNLDFTKTHPNKRNFKFIKGDIQNYRSCELACEGVDFILHQAALGSVPKSIEHPLLYNENNIGGTLNIFESAKKNNVKCVVYASSSSVYGDTPTLPKIESMTPAPKSPYAVSKLTTEIYGKLYWTLYQLPTIGLRYFNVFGPKQNPNSQYAAVIPKFITSFLNNESPIIYGDGKQTRDFTYIDNVIHANIQACMASKSAFGDAFNIGCGDRISINELATIIKAETNSSANPHYKASRAGDVKDSLASIEKAQQHLNLPPFIGLNEGLIKTIEWYTKNTNF